jgi:hypothetical protein
MLDLRPSQPFVKARFPILSLLSVVTAVLFYFGAAFLCSNSVKKQLESAEYNSEDAREDSWRFGALAVMMVASIAAVAGAAVGIILAVVAHFRRERFPALRIMTLTVNGAVVAYALYLVLIWAYRAMLIRQGLR